jgi:hypothetical protein
MVDDYPSNNYNKISTEKQTPKEEPEETKPEVTQVVKGEVVRRKKPLRKRLAETFTGEDTTSVWNYVLMDVLVPAAKDAIVDATSQGIERMIFGEVRAGRGRSSRGSSNYTPYNRYAANMRKDEPRTMSPRGRASHDFDEIVLPTRAEAEDVIERMFDIVSKYDVVSVADLYALVGIKANYVDQKWGWSDLRGLGATRIKNGYLIDIPRPEPID